MREGCDGFFPTNRRLSLRQFPEVREATLARAAADQKDFAPARDNEEIKRHVARLVLAAFHREFALASGCSPVAETLNRTCGAQGMARETNRRAQFHQCLVEVARAARIEQRLRLSREAGADGW
jgi:hypothetical protein